MLMSCTGDGTKLAAFDNEHAGFTGTGLSDTNCASAALCFLLAGGLIERLEALFSGDLDAFLSPLSSFWRFRR